MAANLVRSRRVVGGSDRQLYQILVQGIPGTEMPPQPDLAQDEVWQIVAYLHSLARPGLQPQLPGNASAGREIFRAVGCSECHRLDGDGGFWGPALDSIAARKKADEIRRDVLEPSHEVAEGYRTVLLEAKDGRTIEGLLKNEDTFSVQVLISDGTYVLLSRGEVRRISVSPESAMPSGYAGRLGPDQLRDLLAFLDRQRDPFVPFERGFQNY